MLLVFGILNLVALVLSTGWNNFGMGYGYGGGAINDVDASYQQWMMNSFGGGKNSGYQGAGYGMYPGMQKPNTGYNGNWDYLFKGTGINNPNGYFGNFGKGMGGYQDGGANDVKNPYGNNDYGNNDGYFNSGNGNDGYVKPGYDYQSSEKSGSSDNNDNSDDSSGSSKSNSDANNAY